MYVQLKHPYILKAREFFYFSEETFLAVVLEYCPDGSLVNIIGQIDENQTKTIMKQIAEELVYIHRKEIIHRDIKP
jgi:serine/threonine protein kinase